MSKRTEGGWKEEPKVYTRVRRRSALREPCTTSGCSGGGDECPEHYTSPEGLREQKTHPDPPGEHFTAPDRARTRQQFSGFADHAMIVFITIVLSTSSECAPNKDICHYEAGTYGKTKTAVSSKDSTLK